MAKRSSRIVFAIAGLALIATAAGTTYTLSVILSDRVTSHRGDIAYQLTVTSDTVRGFPTFAEDERLVKYTYSARDGTAPALIELTYASDIHPDDLAVAYRSHCRRQGFETADADDTSLVNIVRCTASDYFITAAVQAGDDGKARVHVSFVSR